jgi:protein ImuB
MYACVRSQKATVVAPAFSPAYEITDAHTVVFEAGSLRRLYPNWPEMANSIAHEAGPDSQIAIAPNPDTAILLARNARGIVIVTRDAAAVLAPLPVESLPLTPELLQTFDTWGIRTIGDLAGLPERGIAERFGPAGVHLQKLSRGAIHRPLKIYRPETVYQERIHLDHPVSLLEPLLFLIARMLNELCEKLLANGMAASEILLTLKLEKKEAHQRALRLPVPMRESKSLLKLLQMDLEAHPPRAPISGLALTMIPVTPRRLQNGLYLPPVPEPGKLELTLARIRGWVGIENVGIPRLLDTHRPEAFELIPGKQPLCADEPQASQPCLAFRYYRPPVSAQVDWHGDRMVRVRASAPASGKVALASGPWRTSGDWWKPTRWERDEWDVALESGVLCRLYCEHEGWFVEGVYD